MQNPLLWSEKVVRTFTVWVRMSACERRDDRRPNNWMGAGCWMIVAKKATVVPRPGMEMARTGLPVTGSEST